MLTVTYNFKWQAWNWACLGPVSWHPTCLGWGSRRGKPDSTNPRVTHWLLLALTRPVLALKALHPEDLSVPGPPTSSSWLITPVSSRPTLRVGESAFHPETGKRGCHKKKKKAQFVGVTEFFSTQLFCSYKSTLSRSLPHTYLRGPTPQSLQWTYRKGKISFLNLQNNCYPAQDRTSPLSWYVWNSLSTERKAELFCWSQEPRFIKLSLE